MLEHIPPQSNGVWIDMGGGTGINRNNFFVLLDVSFSIVHP